ncbi:MAG: capsular biosynthesis protein [Candidatus Methylumidiphilus alinenensis]|uniref:Capsular biosynthesis protein n=1 Tax=Candidatus Methylumidiphilus alinenensis TaxID=2202197 RepID=A0A2W4R7E3_9GAMM|nr:MAG: capsular biosynthesis protein [Candidatus Methylumidiphilus alinenensis]
MIMANRHIVFLQGMPSPFFSRIACKLTKLGCKTTGINLCIGDWIFWNGANTVNYRGNYLDWPTFIARFFDETQVTDIVLLGEQRRYHKQAVEIAQHKGIRVIVSDYGYLRPDWITLERDGMSGNSKFPKLPEKIAELASLVPKADFSLKYNDSDYNMSIGDLIYSFSNVFLFWLYPHYRRSDRRPNPIIYFPAIGIRLIKTKVNKSKAYLRMYALLKEMPRYFLFPLQLEHDFQIVAYSPFDDMESAIKMVIKSFSDNAEKDTRLMIKIHPWDPGLKNWKNKIFQLAKEFSVCERIDYFDGGSLDEMIKGSLGMITVNSTSGIRSLQHGIPVKTLGDAIYNIQGITYQNPLDKFWTDRLKPDSKLVNDLLNAMAGTIQIRGVFFSEQGLNAAVEQAVDRIYNSTVGIPL